MSDLPQSIPDGAKDIAPRAEIMMYVEKPEGWMYSVLKGLAEMPFEDNTFLHWYHTVPNGMPMTEKPSELTRFFFIPPYLEAPLFDSLKIDGETVDILLLLPITENERIFAMDNGRKALEDLFVEKEISPIVDESRTSIV